MKNFLNAYTNQITKFIVDLSDKSTFWFERSERNKIMIFPAMAFAIGGLFVCLLLFVIFHILSLFYFTLRYLRLTE